MGDSSESEDPDDPGDEIDPEIDDPEVDPDAAGQDLEDGEEGPDEGNENGEENDDDTDTGEQSLVKCHTTAGPITLRLHRTWSPRGYDRAVSLFRQGYYDHSHFFRVVPNFLVQFGISYTTDAELKKFADTTISDDPKRPDLMPFKEGYISFAGSGPNSRTSQLFIAYDKAGNLGSSPWETPFGKVMDGMENVRGFYSYGDMPPWGKGPQQGPIRNQGARYIEENFPKLDRFQTCTVVSVKPDDDAAEDGEKDDKAVDASGDSARLIGNVKGESADEGQFPFGLFSIIVVLLVIFVQFVSRRHKGKQDGKSV
ncbi:hypothetical protein ACHAWF_010808 [Thalassiosira exigua]